MSTIRLCRRRAVQVVQGRWTVLIDGVAVGKVTLGPVEEYQVEPGRHIVRIDEWLGAHSNDFVVDCAAGSTSRLVARTLSWAEQLTPSRLRTPFDKELIRVELDDDVPAPRFARRRDHSQSRAVSEPEPAEAPRVVLRETHRSEELLGEDGRQIDNGSAGTVVRSVKVSRRWSKTYRFGGEATRTVGASAELKLTIASAQASVERAVKSSYGLEVTEENLLEEEITITMPPHTSTRLTVRWKTLWQHGVAVVSSPNGALEVPFQVAVGMTFDQIQSDEVGR
ncbi:MAG: hypothetical protein ABI112_06430 [Terracoccus sp.]